MRAGGFAIAAACIMLSLPSLGQTGARAGEPLEAPTPTLPLGRSAAQLTDPRALSQVGMQQRQDLLQAAEAALARGMASSAIIGFERAAMMLHAADSEMGLVRAWMQQGEYRRALAFAAHTAGAHRDAPAASALYAWLLHVGGQGAFADQYLAATTARAPDDAVVTAVLQALASEAPVASGILLDTPHRMAPSAVVRGEQEAAPAGLRQVANGSLLGAGQLVLAPLAPVQGARRIWVRNGLGHMSEARADPDNPEPLRQRGLTLLLLPTPLGHGPVPLAPRDPFAGSTGFAATYPWTAQDTPAWPWIGQGFFGAFDAATGLRKPGIPSTASPDGGPLFDALGRLAGVRVRGADGRPLMVPASMFAEWAQTGVPDATSAPPANGRIGLDEAYERALQVTLQVLVLP